MQLIEKFCEKVERGEGDTTLDQLSAFLNKLRRHNIKNRRLLKLMQTMIVECDIDKMLPIYCVALVNAHMRMSVPLHHPSFNKVLQVLQNCRSHPRSRNWDSELIVSMLLGLCKVDVRSEIILKNIASFIMEQQWEWNSVQILSLPRM
eukprot:TRINITY_DN36180_c0_g1_i1.p1 TRINITY_DN36180_c0_g1~~TRINITY_DN36180_c0_g1_i1.p1  ORF type:complete len:148 (-),score=6.29 TRINITY_DN36180_c0_g1_i1:12-455(-)